MVAALLLSAAPLRAADSVGAATATASRRVLVIGDSLSAAYGLSAQQGWVHLLGARLQQDRPGWSVINASVSGETTAGGAARFDAAMTQHDPDVVVIELGANDALRGVPIEHATANLDRMITRAAADDARVLLIGIRMPPNYGPEYTAALSAMYADLAQRHATALLPFLLEPIATERDAFQADNLHPTAAAQPRLLEHVWPALEPLLEAEAEAEAEAVR